MTSYSRRDLDVYGVPRMCYYKDETCSVVHREDGPAIEYDNGTKHWFINGLFHRENGPASEFCNGSKVWYINGRLHREEGPAIEYASGSKFYYLNGEQYSEKDYWAVVRFGCFV